MSFQKSEEPLFLKETPAKKGILYVLKRIVHYILNCVHLLYNLSKYMTKN
jgi:hypothetical protein